LAKRSDENLSRCLSLLNIYTSIILDERTSNQESKFVSGVAAKPAKVSNRFVGSLLNAAAAIPPPSEKVEEPRWFLDSEWSLQRRTPSVGVSSNGTLDMFVTRPEKGGVTDSALQLLAGVSGGDLLSLLEHYPFLGKVLKDLGIFSSRSLVDKLGNKSHERTGLLGGTVSFIQEAGGKLRAVANPYRWWQSALDPLANSIHDVLRTCPWDCTHNQVLPFKSVQASLKAGDEWFSVDISSATDHFPLEYQMEVLRFVFQGDELAQDMISLFHELSRLPWWYRSLDGQVQTIRWQKGQPMGLRPSFGSFALTHGLVLLALNDGKWNEDFWVLGDDVIIRGEKLHRRYRYFLQRHEIPVAEVKTLRGRYAEFASMIITPSKVIPVYKWRRSTPDNFVDLARLWGPSSLVLFTKRAQKVLKKLANVPDIYGGLGWGDPLQLNYQVPKWIGTRLGRKSEVSLIRSYVQQVYTSDSVSRLGVLPVLDPTQVQDYTPIVQSFINVMGITTTDDAVLRSLASNIVEMYDVHIPSADLDGKPKSKLALWEERLG
jgi:hypothetical protein